jgi:hypothetical protein
MPVRALGLGDPSGEEALDDAKRIEIRWDRRASGCGAEAQGPDRLQCSTGMKNGRLISR